MCHRYFIDFYAKFFFWSRIENRLLENNLHSQDDIAHHGIHVLNLKIWLFWGGWGGTSFKKKKMRKRLLGENLPKMKFEI